ncbi:MAG: hypothetical protein Q9217_003844, partial [Psora testacea]
MSSIKRLFFATFLAALSLPFLASASATPASLKRREDNSSSTSSSTSFTVRAYQSPYPEGQGLTGYHLIAKEGDFFLTKEAPHDPPVLSVDQEGHAKL